MNHRDYLICYILLLVLAYHPLSADMGAIVPQGDAVASESGQSAILLHNGQSEILILATDIKASRQTGLLRFIPLPSEPEVFLAPAGCFEEANALVKKHKLRFLKQYRGGTGTEDVVELRFNRKIGSHDVTVVRITSAHHIRQWAEDYFKAKGLGIQDFTRIEKVTAHYLERGIQYFVFSYIEVGADNTTVEPLAFKFQSQDRLYYPLVTSNLFSGKGVIHLIVCAPTARALYQLYDARAGSNWFKISETALLLPVDVERMVPQAGRFFGESRIVLQVVSYEGELAFVDDIWLKLSEGVPELAPYDPRHTPKEQNRGF
jgi:hypothetical protein